MAETSEQLDRLYGLPLNEFTSARDRLAAELRDQGDRDAATRVGKLRPSTSWSGTTRARSRSSCRWGRTCGRRCPVEVRR